MQGTACELSLVSCRRCCGRRKKIKNKKKGCQCIAVRRQKQRNDNKCEGFEIIFSVMPEMLWKAKIKKGCQCIAMRRQKQRNDNKIKIGIVVQYE